MTHLRLRTQLLIATLLLIGALTTASLLIVRYTVRSQVDQQVQDGINASISAFKSVQRQREPQLSRSAALLAELPTLKALMTTDALTIQDGAAPFFRLSMADLMVLSNNEGKVMALHLSRPGWSRAAAERHLKAALDADASASWWYDEGRLYWVFLRPITAGSGPDEKQLGLIASGYQVDETFADQLARVAGGQVALASNNDVIATSLSPDDARALEAHLQSAKLQGNEEIRLGNSDYEMASVLLQESLPTPVRCYVLLPLTQTNAFLTHLNRIIFALGIAAILFAAILFTVIARTMTRPLDNLVAGVRALAAGDYTYSIKPEGSSEIAELGHAFANMRTQLLESQMHRIEAERIAALGRTASSISHDLRHYLSAVVANAEFLYDGQLSDADREEIYQEIKTASDQMTDLIDSLRELSREHGTITPVFSSLDDVIRRAIDAVNARQEFRNCEIKVQSRGDMEGSFDPRKLERAFFNLALNACEATGGPNGKILFDVQSNNDHFEIWVSDNGRGIPASIRDNLFDPFVSSGKPNGTGLGLAIVSKIVHDHGGDVTVEKTSDTGTVILVRLPRFVHARTEAHRVLA
ncbi:MAG TPA: HAMP domain-containing sensor histidine kinase [Terriglobales bacterium]|nr:HAMP domain-containing sensor histidine kinase [Terriglobales bacterium]